MQVAFEHPANARLIAYLDRRKEAHAPRNRSAPPSVHDLYRNPLGTHPDLADHLWRALTVELPEDCAWVVCARPALVRPSSGVLFGFAAGTHAYALRLPEAERKEALASGLGRVHRFADAEPLDLDELGPEWVLGAWHAREPAWCLGAYHFAG